MCNVQFKFLQLYTNDRTNNVQVNIDRIMAKIPFHIVLVAPTAWEDYWIYVITPPDGASGSVKLSNRQVSLRQAPPPPVLGVLVTLT